MNTRQVYVYGNHYNGEGDKGEPSAELSGTGFEGVLVDADPQGEDDKMRGSDGDPIDEAYEAPPRMLTGFEVTT